MTSWRRAQRRAGGRSPGGASFDPSQIPDLFAWYRGDLGITLNGADVSDWADQSGNSRDLSEATNQPLYTASDASFNNQPTLTFDGVNEKLGRLAFNLGASGTGFTLFVVADFQSNISDGNLAGYAANNVGIRQSVSPNFFIQGRVAGTNVTSSVTESGPESYLLCLDDPGNRAELWVAGNLEVASDPFGSTIAASGDFYVGTNGDATLFGNSAIAEVLLLNRPATSTEKQNLFAYATSRYGL